MGLVQYKAGSFPSGTGNKTVTLDANFTAGNRLVVFYAHYNNNSPNAISDGGGNTWARHVDQENVSRYTGCASALVTTPGNTVTINLTSASALFFVVMEWSGIGDFLGSAFVGVSGTAPSSGNVTIAQAAVLLGFTWSASGSSLTLTEGSGFTLVRENEGTVSGGVNDVNSTEYKEVTTTTAATWTATNSYWRSLGVAFAAGGPPQLLYYEEAA